MYYKISKIRWGPALLVLLVLTRGADAISVQDAVPPDGLLGGSIQHGSHHLVKSLVGVTPQRTLSVFINKAATKSWKETWTLGFGCWYENYFLTETRQTLTSVKRGFVEDQSIFNVVAAVAHHGHGSVLTGGQFLKVNQLDSFCFDHGPLRIRQQVHQSVDSVPLVVANSTWTQETWTENSYLWPVVQHCLALILNLYQYDYDKRTTGV